VANLQDCEISYRYQQVNWGKLQSVFIIPSESSLITTITSRFHYKSLLNHRTLSEMFQGLRAFLAVSLLL